MKNKQQKIYIFIALIGLLGICAIISIIGLIFKLFYGIEFWWRSKEYAYYSDESNFMEVTSEIDHIVWTHSENRLNLAVDHLPDIFSDNDFYIEDSNYTIVMDNGGEAYLELGDTITFVTAPRYFGNGYTMPIVAIKTEDKTLLEFEDGYQNFLDSYSLWK